MLISVSPPFGNILARFWKPWRPLGSQNGAKSGSRTTFNEVQKEVWKLEVDFGENECQKSVQKFWLKELLLTWGRRETLRMLYGPPNGSQESLLGAEKPPKGGLKRFPMHSKCNIPDGCQF